MIPAPPLVLVGATASGKSALALAVARAAGDVEIVSADSMQVYRGMDIGTAKPTAAERREVPHHLVDLVDPSEDFSVARFQAEARAVLDDLARRSRRAIVVGGTGLYLRSLIDGLTIPGQWPEVRAGLEAEPDTAALHRRLRELDPGAADRMEPSNRRRIVRALEVSIGSGRPFSTFGPGLETYPAVPFHLVGLRTAKAARDRRIDARFRRMLDEGLLDEVRALADRHPPLSRTARQALGYRELLRHVEEGAPLDGCVEEALRRTRQFARRQEAWFRRDPRIRWLDAEIAAGAGEVLGDWEDRCRTTATH
ncbi:MAG TPA: tRNA (adenosine(37)-N6)-dimethylallyltransferase MiaA [Acidimicrobiales bacterium]|nr:tRNA (adenosine(37)-N6)-dimethylallyltransferase MiaA [Acidimicrobiales bacterium]